MKTALVIICWCVKMFEKINLVPSEQIFPEQLRGLLIGPSNR